MRRYTFTIFFGVLVILSFVKLYIRSEITILGYQVAALKKKELDLIDARSSLQKVYAKYTTYSELKRLSNEQESN